MSETKADRAAEKSAPRRFVLLDRDGTLVRDDGYLHRIEDYERLPGVIEGLQRLQADGYAFAIITNQSGIGRGYFDEQAFHDFQAHLLADLSNFGISIEGIYFCPHRPDEGCPCRKPEPAMLLQMSRDLGADLSQCWMVGDGLGDVLAAERAGCRGAILVATGVGGETGEKVGPEVPRAADLSEAADIILAGGMED
jgi:D-glycero-D-manno-heptose 1,7-bisphosphate phosphatase